MTELLLAECRDPLRRVSPASTIVPRRPIPRLVVLLRRSLTRLPLCWGFWGAAIASLAAMGGCSESPVSQFRTNSPSEAAGAAFETYDANKDSKLAVDELKACPALVDALQRIDANRDQAIDRAELEARFQKHDKMSDLVAFDLQVTFKGAPLAGATVSYEPEPFMGEGKQSYVGTSMENGTCHLAGDKVRLPAGSVPTGFYKVHIVHQGSGVDVMRGCEVADDSPTANRMAFDAAIEPRAASGGRG